MTKKDLKYFICWQVLLRFTTSRSYWRWFVAQHRN